MSVFGDAGGSLENPDWLRADHHGAAKVGAAGEVRTAELLRPFATGPVSVFHDLTVPKRGYRANIDHVVVVGSTVHVIDSKVWKPGFYFTLGGKTFRGTARFKPAETKTMKMIADSLAEFFASRNLSVTVARPVLYVWPSSARPLRSAFLMVPGARVVSGDAIAAHASKTFGHRAARRAGRTDERILVALSELLPRRAPKAVVPSEDW